MLNYDVVRNWPFPEVRSSYSATEAILYGLGLGYGQDPLDTDQLRFVYEKDQRVVPTMPVVFCHPGLWVKEPALGLDWKKIVHADQRLILHRPFATSAAIIGRTRNTAVIDKGEGRGAIILQERRMTDQSDGGAIATIYSAYFARGDGGFSKKGGGGDPAPGAPAPMPEGAPDHVCELSTLPQQALIYRLSGDRNPLHADPEFAVAAGFPRPILHGLCTFGVAGHAILKMCCGYDPDRLTEISVRFSAPVFPGETIRVEMWQDGATIRFLARVPARDVVVLTNGVARIGVRAAGHG